MSRKKGNGRTQSYGAYFFRANEQDPVVDWLRSKQASSKMSNQKIREAGGPATATMNSWWKGKTRRPQFTTVAAAASAMGESSIPIKGRKR